MSETIHCPYCNAVVPVEGESRTPARVTCPRCGEAVVMPPAAGEILNGVFGPLVATAAAPSSTSRKAGNRRIGFIVLGVMALLIVVATLVLINSRDKRRLTTLAESPTLGYLPDDTNVIITINMTEAERTKEAREALDRLGFGNGGTFDLQKLVGLPRDQVEEAMLGLRVDKLFPPRIRVVVRTKRDIDLDAIYEKLGRKSSKNEGGREYAVVQPSALPGLEVAIWSPSPRTLIAVYPPTDLEQIPSEPNMNAERFAKPLADLLKERPERDTFFWVAAHSDDWEKTSLPLMLLLAKVPMKADGLKKLYSARTFALGFRKDSGVTVTRSRPARVTEIPDGDPRGVALDLAFVAAPGVVVPDLVESLQNWTLAQKLMERGAETKELRHSVTLVGTPEDWERAFGSLRGAGR